MSGIRPAAALAAAVLALRAPAAGGAENPLTLRAALNEAAHANPDLLAARNALAQAEAQLGVARTFPNPTLSTSVSKVPTDGTSASTAAGNRLLDRSYDTVVALTQPFELGGKRKDRRLSAEAAVASARAAEGDALRRVSASVVAAYVAAAAAREGAGVLDETAASLEKSAELALTRETVGDVSASERLQAEVAAGRARADAAGARASARAAVVALETLAGLAPDPERPLGSSVTELLAATARAAATPVTGASGGSEGPAGDEAVLAKRPDLSALRALERKAEADLKLQKAFLVPDPSLLLQYEKEPPDRSNSAGVGVSFPLPLWNRNGGAIRSAEVALDGARLDTRRAEAAARAELAASRVALESAETRARLLREDLVPRADSAREKVAFAYREGGASLLELLEAERSARDVRLASISADADLATARAAWLAARAFPIAPEENE